ncbi:MAG: hypothetical protein AB8B78_01985 [Polaribacter sp.]
MKIKKLAILLTTLITFSCSEKENINQDIDVFCQSGISEFNLNSLEEIQKFKNYLSVTPNCNNFNGSITITDVALDNIEYESLQFLKQLKVIEGSLHIHNVQNLKNLEGLSNLEKIGGSLIIGGNANLESLEKLFNLKIVKGSLIIGTNNKIENLKGLTNINELTELVLSNNPLLKNIDGLTGLKKIKGVYNFGNHSGLIISQNKRLENLKGLSNLTQLGSLRVFENDLLQNVEGLENIKGLFSIDLNNNKSLINIDAFSNVKDLGYLSIKNNQKLRNFEGLNNLETINEVFYLENITADFEANLFPKLKSLGDLQLKEISNLKSNFNSFNGLVNLKQLSIKIINSPVLDGFEKVLEIKNMSISGNGFKEISGFNSFKNGWSLVIEENKDLELISGFKNLENVSNWFVVKNNPKLSNCAIEPFCNFLKKGGGIIFENNSGNCNSSNDVLANCK